MVSWADPFVCPVCESVYPDTQSVEQAKDTLEKLVGALDDGLELALDNDRSGLARKMSDCRAILLPREKA